MTQQAPNEFLEYRKSSVGIREIASRQRALLLCILAGIVLYITAIAGQRTFPLIVIIVLLLLFVAVQITSLVYVFLLTTKLYGTGIGVLLGILTLLPCIGLITLLIINAKATEILKAAGLKVGLLGAHVPDDI